MRNFYKKITTKQFFLHKKQILNQNESIKNFLFKFWVLLTIYFPFAW